MVYEKSNWRIASDYAKCIRADTALLMILRRVETLIEELIMQACRYDSIKDQFEDWFCDNMEFYAEDNIDIVTYSVEDFLSDTFDCGEWGDRSLPLQNQDEKVVSEWREMIQKWQDEKRELAILRWQNETDY